jgi:hypothetical protein
MAEQTYETVDDKAILNVQIPGAMFIRLNQLLTSGLKASTTELMESVARVRANEVDKQNSLDYHIETILVLNGILSAAAKEQGKVKPFTIANKENTQSSLQ